MLSFQRFVIISILVLSAAAVAAEQNYSDLKVDQESIVEIKELHPTQFNIGVDEMKEKKDELGKMSPEELNTFLKANPCPVVIGPDGVPYITDNQHRANAAFQVQNSHRAATALGESGQPTMYMKVVANYSGRKPPMTQAEFEEVMTNSKEPLAYLHDKGKLRSFDQLPKHVWDMTDDPYRSLAGFLKKRAWKVENEYFEQFYVAEWLRTELKLSDKEVSKKLKKKHRDKFLEEVTEYMQTHAEGQSWYLSPEDCMKAKLKAIAKLNGKK